jgi:Protein of unknown function (DUF3592)
MTEKWTILLIIVGPIAGLLSVATIVKYIEVRRARSWLAVPGRIVSAKAVSRPVRRVGSDAQEQGEDTELRNFADVVYEFEVQGKKRRGTRISIGEDLGNGDVAGHIKRYAPGTDVTVYYNPANLDQAVLERDLPENAFQFMAWLIAGLVACSVLAVTGVDWIASVLSGQIPNPKNMPFVMGFSLFALFTALIGRGIAKQAGATKGWSQTTGRIVSSETEKFRTRSDASGSSSKVAVGPYRTHYRQRITYAYQAGGLDYSSDRVAFGGRTSGTIASIEAGSVKRYPEGSFVTVYYDPANPSQAVLERDAQHMWVLWICVALFIAAALWFATTSGGKT